MLKSIAKHPKLLHNDHHVKHCVPVGVLQLEKYFVSMYMFLSDLPIKLLQQSLSTRPARFVPNPLFLEATKLAESWVA